MIGRRVTLMLACAGTVFLGVVGLGLVNAFAFGKCDVKLGCEGNVLISLFLGTLVSVISSLGAGVVSLLQRAKVEALSTPGVALAAVASGLFAISILLLSAARLPETMGLLLVPFFASLLAMSVLVSFAPRWVRRLTPPSSGQP